MFSGGDSQARRKCEMFSIWTKGMADLLNLSPGTGRVRLASLHRITPSLSTSWRRSPDGSVSPSVCSIHERTSLAACGVYFDMRKLRISWSSDDTEAMLETKTEMGW
jgi:hypothetical protein